MYPYYCDLVIVSLIQHISTAIYQIKLSFLGPQCPDGDKNCHLWTAMDLAFFVLMGVVGGLLGALFNCMNRKLAKYRIRHIHPKAKFIR